MLRDTAGRSVEILLQRDHRVVVALHGGDIVRHDGADVILAEAVRHERNDVVDNHGWLGDGASLVDTECIYAGERLNAVHIVDERAAAGEADDAGDEGKAGQKVQSFWDHADDGADGRDHGGDDVAVQPAVFLDEHQHAERNDEKADPFDEARQRAHHLGLWLLARLFGLDGQLGDKRVGSDGGQTCAAAAADNKAAGKEAVAGLFDDLVRFAGDERLIDTALAGDDLGVRADLAAGSKENNIVTDELRFRDLLKRAVPHDVELRGGHDFQLVQLALRTQILNGADDGIAEDDAHERQVQPLADCDYAEGQQEKEHIEIGEDVFLHDLPGSLARRLDRAVVQTGGDPLGHLRFAQAGLRRGEEHGDVDRRLRLRQGF